MSKNVGFRELREDQDLKQDLNIEYVVLRTLLHKAIAHISGDPMAYENAIEEMIDQLPFESQLRIEEFKDEECTEVVSTWKRPRGGWAIGLSTDPYNPVVINRKGKDLDYDPDLMGRRWEITTDEDGREVVTEIVERGGPHWISPIRMEEITTDLVKLARYTHSEYERIGTTWKTHSHDLQTENPEYKPKKRDSPPPNPLY